MALHYIEISEEEMVKVMKDLNLSQMDTPASQELTYRRSIPGTPGIELRVFTSVHRGVSRKCGEDAIRIVLFHVEKDEDGKVWERPVGGKGKVLRVPGWEKRLSERVGELAEDAFTLKKCPNGHYLVVRTAKAKNTTNVKCPECGSNMVIRTARRGRLAGQKFLGCSNFPKCTEVEEYTGDEKTGRVARHKFLGCSHYPYCRYSEEYTGKVTEEDIVKELL